MTIRVGIIGCGNISAAYLRTVRAFEILDCVMCADLVPERAEARATEFDVPKACTPEELLADPSVEIVINLTTPQAHRNVSIAALRAGKHLFTEKPLAVTPADGAEILAEAKAQGLRVGCAPGTPLGGGLQTCRKLIDEGAIGTPVACAAFMMSRGHESWHPDPAYYYKPGAGPMFDMGPYYLSALTMLLGPITEISATAGIQIGERIITSQPRHGEHITVETPDHVTGSFRFADGAIGTIITTFAVSRSTLPRIEIYGTEGTLAVPDPNSLGGPVRLARAGDAEWEQVPLSHGHDDGLAYWGIGVADMAHAIAAKRPHRATGAQGHHVLECMQAFLDASESGKTQSVASSFERPAPLPQGLSAGVLD